MMLIEGFKKDTYNSLKEIQENIGKQLKDLKELHKSKTKTCGGIEQNLPGSKT